MNPTVKKVLIGAAFVTGMLIVLQVAASTTFPLVSPLAKKATGKA